MHIRSIRRAAPRVSFRRGSRLAQGLLLALALTAGAGAAQAADYPDHAVEFIVPWSPGGGSDTLMRVISTHIQPYLGQPMPIINKPGVSGTLGLKDLTRRKADGYTVGQIHDGLMVSHYTGLTPLDWDDFTPVAAMTSSPQYLVVNASSKWKTYKQFVQYAKAHPGKITMGVTLGGVPHLDAAMIEDAEGLKFHYVGFEGTGARVRALVGNHIDAAIGDISSCLEFVKNGNLRFLAVGTEKRQPKTPDVPTFKEQGTDIEMNIVRGIVAPKGTPVDKIETLDAALEKESKNPDFAKSINNAGAEVEFMDHKAYTAYLKKADATIKRLSSKIQK